MISERLYFFMLVTSWGCPLLMILLYANISVMSIGRC
nr:MAG TPA: hypothetical protein [Caudoviricetes sp.]